MTGLSWTDVEHITHGELGRTIQSICPFCSSTRSRAGQRKPVFAVKLQEPDFAIFNCVHCGEHGYVHPDTPSRLDPAEYKRRRDRAQRQELDDRQRRIASALALWNECAQFRGSPAESYLRDTRGIGAWINTFDLDHVFRYHPSCQFGGLRLPCLVALVRDITSDAPVAIHRTTLKPVVDLERRLSLGPIAGGAIKISPHDEVTHGLLIGEGIETVLSASKQFSFQPVWSLIDAGNLGAKFPVLSGIECVTIAVDNDDAGKKAAADCVKRLTSAGVEVITAQTHLAKDFNDLEAVKRP